MRHSLYWVHHPGGPAVRAPHDHRPADDRPRRAETRRPVRRVPGRRHDEDVVPTARYNVAATALCARTGAVPVPNDDDVTCIYLRESFSNPW